ncbi:MAG TPA: S8 family serine peptidase, partial [Chloroflexota bacterium]|nr:S8 family serine peptidase [Chloroflexota bacterium]
VSMSWGDYEFPAYLQYDALFNRPGVVFVASTGDEPLTTQYPATSPYVLAVGGTNVDIAPNGTWKSESVGPGWGGGSSTYEHDSLANGHLRLTPDVSYGAELAFPVYGTINGSGTPNWYLDGGTSGSAPQWAALVARVDQLRSGHPFSSMELRQALAAAGAPPVYEQNFHEIVGHGDPQICPTCTATPGFNVSTGYGSPIANHLIPFLATYGFPKSVP